ncbi:S-type anion channel SLAH1 [Citrus sinensis]|uniref:S-type anion channel SLAH1 n=1 Tax=Citrus sinensis TaxID=2711 RepID=A0ACB8NIH6_CITSI|nr:S-type anion channel SLAH1 [Citrus sinensis]
MANVECNPPVEVVIDSSIITTKQEKFGQSLGVSKPAMSQSSSLLTRFYAGSFRISRSLCSLAMLWKILSEPKSDSQNICRILCMLPFTSFLWLWWLAFFAQASLSLLYILKFLHHVGVNYLYAPWISLLLLLQSAPLTVLNKVSYPVLCWVFSVPVVLLDVKIYGQWFTTEKRFLSVFANPTSQISVIPNFTVVQAAAQIGWPENAVCMFSLHLSGSNTFPSILRPAFLLFFAAPSMGSSAWNSISGAFDTTSKMLFFLSLFLFISLACRPALFKKSIRKFNVAWWAYSFTSTFLTLASVEYAEEGKGRVAPAIMLVLSSLSVLTFLRLMLLTAANTNKLLHEDDPILSFVNNSKSRTFAAQ